MNMVYISLILWVPRVLVIKIDVLLSKIRILLCFSKL